ncbi:caspase Dronc [Ceratitis capitata]|uniref:(Mediterranean fruit fly) hypothetical protein n=1 Tax=Ceratitis capitata TaxID=7213 RepID=A0A811V015_CERCA|nr:caspase Dronc [Ceratitis capitata]CAD7003898.1 unnamed protein product [Ceratitis capitata]
MDDKHRKIIKDNITKLIQHTDFKRLLQACKTEGLLSAGMVNNLHIDSKNMLEVDGTHTLEEIKHQKLFEKITHRGPEAFDKLKKILTYLDYVEALQILEREKEFQRIRDNRPNFTQHSSYVPEKEIDPVPTPAVDLPDSLQLSEEQNSILIPNEFLDSVEPKVKYEVKKTVQMITNDKIGTYSMKSKDNRGILFLVNNIKFDTDYRNGAENDSAALIYVFRQLGFKIFNLKDVSQKLFFDYLEKLLKSEYTRKTECFILALMSHGELNTKKEEVVGFSDGSTVKVQLIIDHFSNVKCPNLLEKPKVLIFPFCRGPIEERGNMTNTESDTMSYTQDKDNNTAMMYKESDLLICFATNKGFKSFRDQKNGSWYVQELCKVIAEHAHDTDFQDIIKIVQRNVSKMFSENGGIQMGNSHDLGFNYKLFLNPGFSEE